MHSEEGGESLNDITEEVREQIEKMTNSDVDEHLTHLLDKFDMIGRRELPHDSSAVLKEFI